MVLKLSLERAPKESVRFAHILLLHCPGNTTTVVTAASSGDVVRPEDAQRLRGRLGGPGRHVARWTGSPVTDRLMPRLTQRASAGAHAPRAPRPRVRERTSQYGRQRREVHRRGSLSSVLGLVGTYVADRASRRLAPPGRKGGGIKFTAQLERERSVL